MHTTLASIFAWPFFIPLLVLFLVFRRSSRNVSGVMQPAFGGAGPRPVVVRSGVASLPLVVAAIVAATYIAAVTASGARAGNWVLFPLHGSAFSRFSSNSVDQTRPVTDFTSIHLSGNFKADVTLNAAPELRLYADPNEEKLVQTSVTDKVLTVSLSPDAGNIDEPIHLHLKTNQIDAVKIDAGASISVSNVTCESFAARASLGSTLRASGHVNKLQATASTGSTVDLADLGSDAAIAGASEGSTMHVKTDGSLSATAAGGSTISADGRADNVECEGTTGSTLNLDHLRAADVTVALATASSATVQASNSVTGSASTGSTVNIRGNPHTVSVNADVSSSVNR